MKRLSNPVAAASRRRPFLRHPAARTPHRNSSPSTSSLHAFRPLFLLAVVFTCQSLVHGQETHSLPRHIRVIVEYIEVSHPTLTAVMRSTHADSGPKIHARMRELVKENEARIMETSIVVARPGQKATVESIGEFIAPTEYEPPGSDLSTFVPTSSTPRLRPETPWAFETKNVGVTLEIEPNLGPHNKLVDLRFAPGLSDRLRLETWVSHHDQWGDASIRRPTYEELRMSTGIVLLANTWGFVGIHSPHAPDAGRDTTRKIMLFVRADVMPIEHPDTWKP